jgi:hypothetical protein
MACELAPHSSGWRDFSLNGGWYKVIPPKKIPFVDVTK